MTAPIEADIRHRLGREGARTRIAGGIGKLGEMIPGGGAVEHRWEGDTLHFTVTAMGQRVASRLTVFDDRVHASIDLPPMLALFADRIRDKLQRSAGKLLE